MLEEVRIRNLGVIDDAQLTFAPGLTVVTGETGAGKTMVLTGVGLLLGAKADARTVRTGTPKATSEGLFTMSAGSPAAQRAQAAGADVDEVVNVAEGTEQIELIVGRHVAASGRSRAFCGGQGVPAGTLAELAADLLTVHGQSDQLLLKSPARQRELLDRFGGPTLAGPAQSYRQLWADHTAARAELAELTAQAEARAHEAERLKHGLTVIEKLDPYAEELSDLRRDINRLGSVEELHNAAVTAYGALAGDRSYHSTDSAVALLDHAHQTLSRSTDPDLLALAKDVHSAMYQAQDVAQELASFQANLTADPEKLAAHQQRLADLTKLFPSYGETLPEVLTWAQEAAAQLAVLDNDPEQITQLEARCEELARELAAAADVLHQARQGAATALSEAVSAELTGLAMPAAQLRVVVTRRADLAIHGGDDVELRLAAHSGVPPVALKDGASGGELSRVMLALEVVASAHRSEHTYIFDEVDSGVGGAAALEIGFRLARLGTNAQVIVVTHLPQVAAFANHHLVVVKHDDGTSTKTTVASVTGSDRVEELARMLAGSAASETACDHAQELLDNAKERVLNLGTEGDILNVHGQPWITSL